MTRFIFFVILLFSKYLCADWNIVYLASFPRSGNHWVRFLIEEATHIATSSVYRDGDYPHLPSKFPWGGYATDHGYKGNCRYPREEDPVILKTHHPYFLSQTPLIEAKTICLIRHPIDAFYSFHVYFEKKWRRAHRSLRDYLPRYIRKWRLFYEFWEKQSGVVFIRYEDLVTDPISTLTKILKTVDYKVGEEDVKRAIDEFPPTGGILKHLSQCSQNEINMVYKELEDLLLKYGYL